MDEERRPLRAVHRALADPLRIRVLDALWVGPCSVKELAAWVDTRPDGLYHHLRQLERAGLIEVAEYRRLPRGKVERVYRRVPVEPPGDAATHRETAEFLGQMLLATRMGIDQACAAKERGGDREVALTRTGVHLTRRRLQRLRAAIEAAVAEAHDDPDEDGVWTEILVTIVDQQDRQPRPADSSSGGNGPDRPDDTTSGRAGDERATSQRAGTDRSGGTRAGRARDRRRR